MELNNSILPYNNTPIIILLRDTINSTNSTNSTTPNTVINNSSIDQYLYDTFYWVVLFLYEILINSCTYLYQLPSKYLGTTIFIAVILITILYAKFFKYLLQYLIPFVSALSTVLGCIYLYCGLYANNYRDPFLIIQTAYQLYNNATRLQ